MALPEAREARPYYQTAKQRFEDARFLLEAERTTGAVYLAGYCVECMLKALVLSRTPAGRRGEMLATLRGARGHDFDWLKARYFGNGGSPFPPEVAKAFSFVDTWGTETRYVSGATKRCDAERFLEAVEEIMIWADGRL